MLVTRILLTVFFSGTTAYGIIVSILFMAGLWMMFEKSGIRGWWALFPGAREYQLSRCAGRESDGPVYSVSSVGIIALQVIQLIDPLDSEIFTAREVTIIISLAALLLVCFIYSIRVYSGLIEVYGVRKRWILLWIVTDLATIPALIWGFSKKYQPAWKVEDFREEMARLASHGSASVMSEGLTVNLTERSAVEYFRRKVLLRDIHMAIPQGHMVLLLGGSGAGKTTYLNAINGYEKARAEVLLNGTNLYKHYKKMQYEVGFVPQSEMMRGKDTVLHTLLDAAKLRLPTEVSAEQRKARVNEVMEIFGLTPVKNNLVEKLSGGQKKRLSISMEFISNPSLFILDEPDSGLDGVMARELFVQLRKIADTGKIVIVITHTPDRVIDLFDDVIVLAKDSARTGRLAFYGSIEDARTFFQRDKMEQIVKSVNRVEEGGDGLADEFVMKYAKEVA
ncbi:MAG: ATP-binding cassette domain-containing protein [Blautia sp.]|nr:ATP-binding cassette domain-containing protein [Blautia sp.]